MKISLDYMILNMGISLQCLQEPYKNYEQRMTPIWLKSLWEKCDWFDVMIEFKNTPLEFSCCGDKWLMREFLRCGLLQISWGGLTEFACTCKYCSYQKSWAYQGRYCIESAWYDARQMINGWNWTSQNNSHLLRILLYGNMPYDKWFLLEVIWIDQGT